MSVGPDPDGTVEVAGRFTALGGIRRTVARGTIVNTVFLVGVTVIGFLKGFMVAGFLTVQEYGLWGIIIVTVSTLTWILSSGFGQKYVQQEEADQELAFQKAFTLELVFGMISLVIIAALVPLILLAYGEEQLLPAALVFALYFPSAAFTAPLWVFYRQMNFVKQRVLEGLNPIVSFVVTIGLAAAGAGYWSLVLGLVIGSWASAAAAIYYSPYPLRLRYDRGTARDYVSFSWPLLIYGANGLVIAQVSVLFGTWQLGVAAVGAITLTATITQLTQRVDAIVTGTLYPAICAMQDRTQVLLETFVKSNRMALMWGMPFGVGLTLFASDVVHFGIGDKWEIAIGLLQAFGLIAAVNQIGFNWDAFYRARDNTRPMAIVSGVMAGVFVVTAIPGMILWGLDGFAAGMAAMTLAGLFARTYYLVKLFPGFNMYRHLVRAVLPTIPAAAVVLAVRQLDVSRSLGVALAEVALYVAVTIGATLLFERRLVAEMVGYLRKDRAVPAIS
jgi:O-antigen/teichoic acid export membrane protein